MPKLADLSIPLDKRIKRSKKNYENKRALKSVSFNTEIKSQSNLYNLTKKFKFSEWVKKVLTAFSLFEVKQLIKGEITIPTILIEDAIDSGQFNIEAYLESKGMKMVGISTPTINTGSHAQYEDHEFNQEYEYSQDPEYSQQQIH